MVGGNGRRLGKAKKGGVVRPPEGGGGVSRKRAHSTSRWHYDAALDEEYDESKESDPEPPIVEAESEFLESGSESNLGSARWALHVPLLHPVGTGGR